MNKNKYPSVEEKESVKKSRDFIRNYKSSESISLAMSSAIKTQTKSKEVPDDLKPFQGYSPNPKLTRASIACTLM